eukprot:SAG11_NODE_536_length_8674_cov_6.314985_7_plen_96_part_00
MHVAEGGREVDESTCTTAADTWTIAVNELYGPIVAGGNIGSGTECHFPFTDHEETTHDACALGRSMGVPDHDTRPYCYNTLQPSSKIALAKWFRR